LGLLSSNVLVHPSDYLLVPELRQYSVGYGKRILGITVGTGHNAFQTLLLSCDRNLSVLQSLMTHSLKCVFTGYHAHESGSFAARVISL